jgi:hypothetical protein
MTTFTPILQTQEVAPSQNNKEVTINDGFVSLENATQQSFIVTLVSNAASLSVAQFVGNFAFKVSGQSGVVTLHVPLQQRDFAVWNTGSYAVNVSGVTGAVVNIGTNSIGNIYCDGTNCAGTSGSGGSGGISNINDGSTTVTAAATIVLNGINVAAIGSTGASLTARGMLPLCNGDTTTPAILFDSFGQCIGVPL